MKFTNIELGLSVMFRDELISKMYSLGKKHYPKEYGGLLIGCYSENKKIAYCDNIILPKKYKSSKFGFERGNEGLKKALTKLYKQTPSLIYIGEWHTHPDNPPIPSKTDLNAIYEIANDERVLITSPILLIISLDSNHHELGVYVYFKNKMHKYEEEK